MRADRLYLVDIIEAADAIGRFLAAIADKDEFFDDELRQSAVLQKLIIIGEAASRLSPEMKAQAAEVEWTDIIGFRNIAIHAYFSVNWRIVWTTATQDVPFLRKRIEALLAKVEDQVEDDRHS